MVVARFNGCFKWKDIREWRLTRARYHLIGEQQLVNVLPPFPFCLISLCFFLASEFLHDFRRNTIGVLDISKFASFRVLQVQIYFVLVFEQFLAPLTGKYPVMPVQMGPAIIQC